LGFAGSLTRDRGISFGSRLLAESEDLTGEMIPGIQFDWLVPVQTDAKIKNFSLALRIRQTRQHSYTHMGEGRSVTDSLQHCRSIVFRHVQIQYDYARLRSGRGLSLMLDEPERLLAISKHVELVANTVLIQRVT